MNLSKELKILAQILPFNIHIVSHFDSRESTLKKDIGPHQPLTTFIGLQSAVEQNSSVIYRK